MRICLPPDLCGHNGLVERFHRQLKAALKAQHNPSFWMDALPLVLLGVRTALKEDTSSMAAEMVYGTTLRLPGEFFTPSSTPPLPDPSDCVTAESLHATHSSFSASSYTKEQSSE